MNSIVEDLLEKLKQCDDFHNRCDYLLEHDETTYLLDYITNLQTIERQYSAILSENAELENKTTNLQQENETRQQDINNLTYQLAKMKEENERLKDDFKNDVIRDVIVERDGYLEQLEDYKSRCEKASEYIDKQKKKMYKSRNKIAMFILMKLENILQMEVMKNEYR